MTEPGRVVALLLLGMTLGVSSGARAADTDEIPDQAGPLARKWYTAHELLPLLAERDGLRWAMPETLAGRALVGGDRVGARQALGEACKQWGLTLTVSGKVVVVHRGHDDALKKWSLALERGGAAGVEAAWELGWLRDGRAIPVLAEALESKEVAVGLAAAQALETLLTEIPLGRDERVDPPLPGRVSLAEAFPPRKDLTPLLASPYPAVRAAALRVLLGQGGKTAEQAWNRTAEDRAFAVLAVRQQARPEPVPGQTLAPPRPEKLPAPPADVKAACAKMVGELPGLEKNSAWEEMQRRVRIMAEWSRAGHDEATYALLELTGTRIQHGWFPGYVQKALSSTGSERVRGHLKALMPKADRATLSRGLEEGLCGEALLEFTRPYLNEQTICYVSTRTAGREAHDDLLALAGKGDLAAIDALGVVGGPKAVAVLKGQLNKDEKGSATLAFRSAKALGRSGGEEALEALREASASKSHLRRHAAALFLGQIGGPKATATLKRLAEKDDHRLVRAAAADALEQIGGEEAQATVAAFRKGDAGRPELAYRPRNPRFGPDFPVNEWVNLKIPIQAFAAFGEMGWNHDAANRLFFRYGGCSGYTNELTVFDLGTEQFVQRRPNEEMAGWGDRRPPRGCSAGRTWDPYRKVAWIGPAIGGTAADLAIAEYYNRAGGHRFCSYDLATDRFRPAPIRYAPYGEPPNRFAYDWKHGLMYPVKFQHQNHKTRDWWALDTRAADPYTEAAWVKKTNPNGDYPRYTGYATGAVDQESGLLVVHCPPFDSRPAETWLYDPEKNVWKEVTPKNTPQAQAGAGFAYDPFHKVLLLQGGKKVSQYGGPADSLTWTYDVRTNTWTDLGAKNGPGNPWVGAMDFDPEHNVFVLFNFRDHNVWAYRHQQVKVGTVVKEE